MEKVEFKTWGTCARKITFKRDDENRIFDIEFDGGCNGNLKAVSRLCNGMKAEEIATRLKGNTCGAKKTSCADQLARAVLGEAAQ